MKFKKALCVLFCGIALFGFSSCTPNIKSEDLMKNIKASNLAAKDLDDSFIADMAEFSIELFKQTVSPADNPLISPTSVVFALAMAANGADNSTLTQIEQTLCGGESLSGFNNSLYSFKAGLVSEKKSKLDIANSIWFRDSNHFTPKQEFLQANADYYKAAAYKSKFDSSTVKDINNWVKWKTNKMIDKIIDSIPAENLMYIINAVAFDAEWQNKYEKSDIKDGRFTSINGITQNVSFMYSRESGYLEDEYAKGFIKPYYNNNYSLVAMLPNEDTDINQYVDFISGTGFINTIKNANTEGINIAIPKFSYEYAATLNGPLMQMGITDAFSTSAADFSRLGSVDEGNIFISEVLHKTFISVDEGGTKAAAVTSIGMGCTAVAPSDKTEIIFDRPFLYAIIDNATKLPVFIGILADCK